MAERLSGRFEEPMDTSSSLGANNFQTTAEGDDMLNTGYVKIQNVSPRTNLETLKACLESPRQNGGEILYMKQDVYRQRVFVRFADSKVAARFIQIGTIKLDDVNINISYPDEEDLQYNIHADRTVLVTDLPQTATRDSVTKYFENEDNGGGNIAIIRLYKDRSAAITFESSKAAERLSSESCFHFEGAVVKIIYPVRSDKLGYARGVNQAADGEGYIDPKSVMSLSDIYDDVQYCGDPVRRSSTTPARQGIEDYEHPTYHPVSDGKMQRQHQIFSSDETSPNSLTTPERPKLEDKMPGTTDSRAERTVLVHKIGPAVTHDALLYFFENEKRSGGGDVADLTINHEAGTAVVVFEAPEVARRLVERTCTTFDDTLLAITKPRTAEEEGRDLNPEPPSTSTHASINTEAFYMNAASEESAQQIYFTDAAVVTGFVSGISSDLCKKVIGKIQSISQAKIYQHSDMKSHLFVRLELVVDARRLSRDINIDSMTLSIKPVNNIYCSLLMNTRAVVVESIPAQASTQAVILALESSRNSGGPIEDLERNENIAVATFTDSKAAHDISQRQSVIICDTPVNVKLLQPTDLPLLIMEPVLKDKLLVKGFPPSCTLSTLMEYFSQRGSSNVILGNKPGRALVEFKRIIDYAEECRFCIEKPLGGNIVSVEEVAVPCAIQVSINRVHTKEMLRDYFEDRKSGGGPVLRVSMHHEHNMAVVTFMDRRVLQGVLTKQHSLRDNLLEVHTFYEGLGLVLPIPNDVRVCFPSPEIAQLFFEKPKAKQMAETVLGFQNGKLCWPLNFQEDAVVVQYCETSFTVSKRSNWETRVRATWTKIIERFSVFPLSVSQEAYQSFIDNIRINYCEKDCVIIKPNSTKSCLIVVGEKTEVEKYVTKLKKIKDSLEEQLRVEEVPMSLENSEIQLLSEEGFFTKAERTHINLKIECLDKCVKFRGPLASITSVQNEIHNILSNKCEFVMNSQNLVRLFKMSESKKTIMDALKINKIPVVFDAQVDTITMFSLSKEYLKSGKMIVSECIVERVVEFTDEMIPAFHLPEWQTLCSTLRSRYRNKIVIAETLSSCNVVVAGLRNIVDSVVKSIEKFLAENVFEEHFVDMPFAIVKFLQNNMREVVLSFAQHSSASINFILDHTRAPGVSIKARKLNLKKLAEELQKLRRIIKVDHLEIISPGLIKLISGEKGSQLLNRVEFQERVTIDVNLDGNCDTVNLSTLDVTPLQTPDVKCVVEFSSCKKIYIAKGDLPHYQVDAIVNAANTDLRHHGGVASAILKAGGEVIDEDCAKYIQQNRKLFTGDCFMSRAGQLPCKYVIHAVGPRWKGGSSTEKEELHETVYSILEKASENKLVSIAVPLISSGIFGFPPSLGAKVIVGAVDSFLSKAKTTSLQDIHLVDNSDNAISCLESALTQKYGNDRVKRKQRQPETSKKMLYSSAVKLNIRDTPLSCAATACSVGDTSSTRTLPIRLIKGNIADQTSDIIVNTSDPHLHNSGAVSKVILEVAGHQLQKECKARYPRGILPGDVAETPGYSLSCQKVYHVACIAWDGGTGQTEQVLRKIILNCLYKANDNKMRSISFPALGTGNLKVPPAFVARVISEEISSFERIRRSTSLKQVNIVVYPKDTTTIQAFEKVLAPKPSLRVETDFSATDHQGGNYGVGARPRDRNPTQTDASPQGATDIIRHRLGGIQLGNCLIRVKQGDITKEETDAIVNTTGGSFTAGGAVTKAIMDAAGRKLRNDLTARGQIKDGIEVTDGGDLPCKFIIHLQLNKETVPRCIQKVLQIAEQKQVKSLSIPAVGTGGGRKLKAQMAAEATLRAIVEYIRKGTGLTNINICIFAQSMVATYQKALDMFLQQGPDCDVKTTTTVPAWEKGKPQIADANAESVRPKLIEIPKNVAKITLCIYSNSTEVIQKAKMEIEKFFQQECKPLSIDDPMIAHFTESHMEDIKAAGIKNNVVVKVQNRHQLNRINLVGCQDDLDEMTNMIKEMLERTRTAYIEENVIWSFDEDGAFSPYPKDINIFLERTYQRGEQVARWTNKKRYEVHFGRMYEKIGDSYSTRVNRIKVIPDNWDKSTTIQTILDQSSDEYKKIESRLQDDISNAEIKKIERIQNKQLFRQYTITKQQMRLKAQERKLWFGATSNFIDKINQEGFSRSVNGNKESAYGKGTYFTVSATDSDLPAKADSDSYIYLCQVLVGEFKKGAPNMTLPPPKSTRNPGILCDCCVDNETSPSIFVIFNPQLTYPEYLVTFKKNAERLV